MKYVDIQRRQFRMLGVLGDWDHPYLTLSREYETGVIEVFTDLVRRGYVYRGLRPIHWCIHCETALAEAEIEYEDTTGPSIYVAFPSADRAKLASAFGVAEEPPEELPEDASWLIWTTTPWTLPANLAIAVHPRFHYALVKFTDPATGRPRAAVCAADFVEGVLKMGGAGDYKVLGRALGKDLAGLEYRHAFLDRVSPVVLADYVTLTDGTGCVHTAPGHGRDDYFTGLENGLEIFCPVDHQGKLMDRAGAFAGTRVFDADPLIVKLLGEKGALWHSGSAKHSYPHCWRCKKPVIFRATEQWFINVDHEDLRKRSLEAIKRTKWVPSWGETRITGMVSERPDWCISRQRSWGVPIPAFYCVVCGEVLLTVETCEHVRNFFAAKGADAWFTTEPKDVLPADVSCAKCGGKTFRRENDIFDVWFESGSSHRSVLRKDPALGFPCELYLEGNDQHRGWFQVSLLTAMAADGQPPFRTVVTHGWVVDEKGEKMSKSLGNVVMGQEAAEKFGADVVRLWLSSVDYTSEINVSMNLINRMSDAYRRIRNTFRYLLGNLAGFDPSKDKVGLSEMLEIDRWALSELQHLVERVTEAYEEYEFHRVYHEVHNFCAVEMSAFYLDVLKDRLYCEAPSSLERRSAQTAMHEVLHVLVKLVAPILVHTAHEVWEHIPDREKLDSVHLALWPEVKADLVSPELDARFERLMKVREEVAREIEKMRAAKTIGSGLEVAVELYTPHEGLRRFLDSFAENLSTYFITSDVKVASGMGDGTVAGTELTQLYVKVAKNPHPKCLRCWGFRRTVGSVSQHPALCERCAKVVGGL
jgi:isoleucyl-tRNA synthetase